MNELKGKKFAIIGTPACVGAIAKAEIAKCEEMGAVIVYAANIEKARDVHGVDLLLAMPERREELNHKDMGELLMDSARSAAKAFEDLRDSINFIKHEQKNQSYNNRYAKRAHRKSRW